MKPDVPAWCCCRTAVGAVGAVGAVAGQLLVLLVLLQNSFPVGAVAEQLLVLLVLLVLLQTSCWCCWCCCRTALLLVLLVLLQNSFDIQHDWTIVTEIAMQPNKRKEDNRIRNGLHMSNLYLFVFVPEAPVLYLPKTNWMPTSLLWVSIESNLRVQLLA